MSKHAAACYTSFSCRPEGVPRKGFDPWLRRDYDARMMSCVTEGVARTSFDPCRKIKQHANRGAAVGQRGFRTEALTLGYKLTNASVPVHHPFALKL